ncbi:hypothetical protein JY494_27090 [Serratia marcescens]|uniref:hypothetical protein n=1 Tax=Serratia grimesii TaxID=82995 RepID=UPI0021788B0F|nr:hypothetical protein [Serratia grimesii]MBN5203182.1 hypothetical protein [Serratia marcescens]CAI1097533.1 Uncharacterised protein [Serratia grimesii]
MSFNVTKKMLVATAYPDLVMQSDEREEDVTVTYNVAGISRLDDNSGVAKYTVTINGSTSPWVREIDFHYSGNGNPLEEAEQELKKHLKF